MSEHDRSFHKLLTFLSRIPAVQTNYTPWGGFGSGLSEAGWWVKLTLDIDHDLAWNTVQEIGYVLNGLSLSERLPTVFKPVSPPPYLTGGPHDYLSWVIECHNQETTPELIADWLESRLPSPVEDGSAWSEAK